MGRAVPVSKNGCVDILHSLASKFQVVLRGSESTKLKLADREATIGALELKVQFLADKAGRVGDFQK